MLGDTISDLCRNAKQSYAALRAYDTTNAPLKTFDAGMALQACWLMMAWYGSILPKDACTTCAGQVYRTTPSYETLQPEVCAAATRKKIVDAIATWIRAARPAPPALVAYLGNDAALLALALEKEASGEPLRAWMTLAQSVGAPAGTSRILGALIYWAKGGPGSASPATRAHALKAMADIIGAGTRLQLVRNIYDTAAAIQVAAAAKAAQTGDPEWQTVAGEAAAVFGAANLLLAKQAMDSIPPLETEPGVIPWARDKATWLGANWPLAAAGAAVVAVGTAAAVASRRRRRL
jgi:hypothetical protein